MFGIDQISWEQFGGFVLGILLCWYLSVILMALYHKRYSRRNRLFEDTGFELQTPEDLKPVFVRSPEFPSQLLPFPWESDLPLSVSFYEETGLDEGYAISCFSGQNDPRLPNILEHVHFQQ